MTLGDEPAMDPIKLDMWTHKLAYCDVRDSFLQFWEEGKYEVLTMSLKESLPQ